MALYSLHLEYYKNKLNHRFFQLTVINKASYFFALFLKMYIAIDAIIYLIDFYAVLLWFIY